MSIALLDSGIGGVTVLHKAMRRLPHESFVYFADSLHVPYGTKTKEEVKQYIFEAVGFIHQLGVKALVVACNTATSIAIQEIRERYALPVIGMEPAVKPAVAKALHSGKRVMVLATPLTLMQDKYHHLIANVDPEHIVDAVPTPELVDYCEKLVFDDAVILPYLEQKLASYDLSQYSTLVLGCTHFPFFRQHLQKLLPPAIDLIDGSDGTINRLTQLLADQSLLQTEGAGQLSFYSSGDALREQQKFNFLLERLNRKE